MPTPAGTGLTRRTLITRGAAGALAVYGASRFGLDQLREGIAAARPGTPNRTLVSVFLPGGLDSLSLLAPVGDSQYAALRPTLALREGSGPTFSEDDRLMWAPQAAGLTTLHGEGKVSVIPAVGYDHPDQSHFTSRHFWEVGATDVQGRFGWMGRFLDLHGDADNPLQGLSLDWTLSPALAAADVPVAAVARPDDFGLWAPGRRRPGRDADVRGDRRRSGGCPPPTPSAASRGSWRPRSTTSAARWGRSRRTTASRASRAPSRIPTATSRTGSPRWRRCSTPAFRSAASPSTRRAASTRTPTRRARSATTSRSSADALLAFQRDLEARGIADRVLTQVWSEFGRRPEQNDTGTDHGAGGVAFVMGTKAKGQQIGEFPGLATLDDGDNLVATADFRGVYCSLLEQWFGVDAAPIIPGASSFTRPVLVA